MRCWGAFQWNLKGGLNVARLGGGPFLFEFENKDEAERVLHRGIQHFKENILHLERWGGMLPKKCTCQES